MVADILHNIRKHTAMYNDEIQNECLIQISTNVSIMSNWGSMRDVGLLMPQMQQEGTLYSEYLSEVSYNASHLEQCIASLESKLSKEQMNATITVLQYINEENGAGKIFYLVFKALLNIHCIPG